MKPIQSLIIIKLLILSLLTTQPLFSQNYTLSGNITDQENPVAFASVVIQKTNQPKPIKGGYTDENGYFSFSLPKGNYNIKITHIKYQELIKRNIQIEKNIHLNELTLEIKENITESVIVTAEKSSMEVKATKRVFNVGKDLANIGGAASDILENIPSISLDVDGNVSLRGDDGVRLLLNGKQSGILNKNAANYLQNLDANTIEKVEIITNPGAKYSATGQSGIINIVLKQNQVQGFNSTINISTAFPQTQRASLDVNYGYKNLNIYSNINARYVNFGGYGIIDYEKYYINTKENHDIQYNRKGLSLEGRLGFDYKFNKNNKINAAITYDDEDREKTTETDYLFTNLEELTLDSTIYQFSSDNKIEKSIDLEFGYQLNFDKKGHDLELAFNYSTDDEDKTDNTLQRYDFQDGNDIINRNVIIEDKEIADEYELRIDYKYPFSKKQTLTSGFKLNNEDFTDKYREESEFENQPEEDHEDHELDEMTYNEQVYAGYISYEEELDLLSYLIGLRYEYSDKESVIVDGESLITDYSDLFPSLHFAYNYFDNDKIYASYSKRIRRPRISELIPFHSHSFNEKNKFVGNSLLTPEYTNSLELGMINEFELFTFTPSIYFKQKTDLIERINRIDTTTDITYIEPHNVGTQNNFGVELILSGNYDEWIRYMWSFNLYGYNVNTSYLDYENIENKLTFDTKLSSSFFLTKASMLQLNINLRGPNERIEGIRETMLYSDLAYSHELFDGSLVLSASLKDVFNTRKFKFEIDNSKYKKSIEFQRRERQLVLGLKYFFNKKGKSKSKKNNRNGSQDSEGMF